MSVRSWLGLCEHKWEATDRRIECGVGLAQGFGEKIVTGHIDVLRCEKCGLAKGVRLS